nr:DNA helicase [Tanacetum cinerariifolium]
MRRSHEASPGKGPTTRSKKRLHHFGREESGLKREIVEGWIDFLNNNNALVQLFTTAQNKMSEVDIPEYQQLQERVRQYNMITRGRLFQQYVFVTAYCAIEQSRTDFLRPKQNEIRNEFLSTLYYAITRSDLNGRDAGSRIILLVSFTGGPRANVIDRVLQHLTAERSKVCKDEEVDAYISAELPDPIVDLEGLRFVSEFMIYRPCGLGPGSADSGSPFGEYAACQFQKPSSFVKVALENDVRRHSSNRRW